MSLVEQALKKIQQSRGAQPPRPQPPLQMHVPTAAPDSRRSLQPPPTVPVRGPVEPAQPSRIVHIDRNALRAAGIVAPAHQERRLADEYRQIKRPLIANAQARGAQGLQNGHLIMMASALPGDGKTFTSINLALSMALEKDVSVLLVDADVAKPHISEIFGAAQERGLLDVLRDAGSDVESVILRTDLPGLSILPAGRASSTATELLASARMEQIIAQIGARDPNRVVLFDSPPLLLTSEARALATVVGQIVLVVRAGSTPQRAVADALDLLGEDKSIALVLNQSDERSHIGYYQYYGQRGEQDDPPTS